MSKKSKVNSERVATRGSEPSFGTHAPTAFQAKIISFTRSMPDNWLGRRFAFMLRRLVLRGLDHPLDVEVFGCNMRLHPLNNVCEKRVLFTPQYFDPAERAALAERAIGDIVFIDVGANVGVYSLFVAALAGPRARVLAIEPQPVIFDRLVYNIAQNPSRSIKALSCALADRDGEMTLFVDTRNRGESSVKILGWSGDTGQSVQVPTRTLLGVIEDEGFDRIDAVKIDVEGAEDLILAPFLRDAPDKLLPDLFIMENARARWQTDCIALLEQKGYRVLIENRLNVVMERQA